MGLFFRRALPLLFILMMVFCQSNEVAFASDVKSCQTEKLIKKSLTKGTFSTVAVLPEDKQQSFTMDESTGGILGIEMLLDGSPWLDMTLVNESSSSLAYQMGPIDNTSLVEPGTYTVMSASGDIMIKGVSINTTGAQQFFTVTFDGNGGSSAPAAQIVFRGAKAISPNEPTGVSGKDFIAWTRTKNGNDIFNFATEQIAEKTTLYALYSNTATTPKIAVNNIKKTYDGIEVKANSIKGTAKIDGAKIDGKFTFDDKTPILKNPGTYTVLVKFTPTNAGYHSKYAMISVIIDKPPAELVSSLKK